jgi:hypothetical protein
LLTHDFKTYRRVLGATIASSIQQKAETCMVGVQFLAAERDFLFSSIHTGSGSHPTYYVMGTRGKSARA